MQVYDSKVRAYVNGQLVFKGYDIKIDDYPPKGRRIGIGAYHNQIPDVRVKYRNFQVRRMTAPPHDED